MKRCISYNGSLHMKRWISYIGGLHMKRCLSYGGGRGILVLMIVYIQGTQVIIRRHQTRGDHSSSKGTRKFINSANEFIPTYIKSISYLLQLR